MPIEIRELVIQAELTPAETTPVTLTTEDLSRLKEEILASLPTNLTPDQRRELKEDTLREVRKMLEDRWRR